MEGSVGFGRNTRPIASELISRRVSSPFRDESSRSMDVFQHRGPFWSSGVVTFTWVIFFPHVFRDSNEMVPEPLLRDRAFSAPYSRVLPVPDSTDFWEPLETSTPEPRKAEPACVVRRVAATRR
jgi:hypothetical protein